MPDPDDVDAPLIDALRQRVLVFVRDRDDRSVVVDYDGRRVLVACTEPERLAAWWREHAGADADAPYVRELPFRQLVGLWAAPDVDLLVDPGPGGGALVPVGGARRHLDLGPVVAGKDPDEPLPFAGFTGGRASVRVPLIVVVISLVLLVMGLTQPRLVLVLGGLVGVGAGWLLGRRGFGQLAAARAATRRLAQSDRLRRQG
ncbi:hypothetical protein GCM10027446_20890 [Angustibacter peucedani]